MPLSSPENHGIDDKTANALLGAARGSVANAYVPYSGFPVGAALLTVSGEIVTGVNVENASYGLTTCAERVAVQTAVARGHREFLAVAVSAPKAAGTTPCGACRQVLNEFSPRNREMFVILDYLDSITVVSLAELLPQSFGRRNLDN